MNPQNIDPSRIIDVREEDEVASIRIPGARHLPLSRLDQGADDMFRDLRGQRVVLMCRSGARARMARSRLEKLGCVSVSDCEVFEGGIEAWKNQGGLVRAGTRKQSLPIMQQVQIVIGTVVGASSLAAWFLSPKFLVVSLAVSCGLLFAGLSGRCLMAELLAKLPFNRSRQEQ